MSSSRFVVHLRAQPSEVRRPIHAPSAWATMVALALGLLATLV